MATLDLHLGILGIEVVRGQSRTFTITADGGVPAGVWSARSLVTPTAVPWTVTEDAGVLTVTIPGNRTIVGQPWQLLWDGRVIAGGTVAEARPQTTPGDMTAELYVNDGDTLVEMTVSLPGGASPEYIDDAVADGIAGHVADADPHGDRAHADEIVATEAGTRAAAVTALDGRLDTVEATLPLKADLVNTGEGLRVPSSQIGAVNTFARVPVLDQAARLALTAAQIQPGDVAVELDDAQTWQLLAADPSVPGNWLLLNASDAVQSVNGQTGAVVLGAANVGADPAGTGATQAGLRLLKTANLSDLQSVPTAWANLGLGNVASRTIGTVAGQVRDAGDGAYTNARTPTAHAASHATAGTDPITPASIGAAKPSARWVGPPIDAYTSTAASQTANLVYYTEVEGIDRDLPVSTAWTEFTVSGAFNWVAGIFRVDTGAIIAATAPTAMPGIAGVASAPIVGGPITVPGGVGLVLAIGSSAGSGAITWRGLGASMFYGTGGPLYGSQTVAAALALPATLPAQTTLARRPLVAFT